MNEYLSKINLNLLVNLFYRMSFYVELKNEIFLIQTFVRTKVDGESSCVQFFLSSLLFCIIEVFFGLLFNYCMHKYSIVHRNSKKKKFE